jgi:hypothetical protein
MRVEVDRLTSLFGGSVAVVGLRKMGAAEPWEKMEGASGPILDLVLS